MSTSSQKSDSSQKPDETALILEHVELLLAFQEEQEGSGPGDFSHLLDSQAAEIAISVESQIEKRFEILESQIEKICSAISDQNMTLEAIKDTAPSSPVSTEEQEEQLRELEQRFDNASEKFSEKTDTIAGLFKSQIDQMIENLSSSITILSQGVVQKEKVFEAPVFRSAADDSTTHWEKQKEAMLSKYGIDPDYRPVMELPETQEPIDSEAEPESVDATERMSEADAAAIEELKERLNTKLRDAEVEFSISRAKLCQQQAELAEEQVELDRRAAAIEEKYAAVARIPKRRVGFFGWLWQHLKPKQPKANDRA